MAAKPSAKAKIGVLGASGYTGSELVRLLLRHPQCRARAAHRRPQGRAGDARGVPAVLAIRIADAGLDRKRRLEEGRARSRVLRAAARDHAEGDQAIFWPRRRTTKVVDLSADFRLHDAAAYARWYGHEHHAPKLQGEAVYGLVEVHRDKIKKARLVANPGCYTSCAQLALTPLLKAKAIAPDEIVIDAKSGMTGAGRAAKEEMLFSEVSEGFHAYGVGHHRHMAELDQEFSAAAGRDVVVSFTPHLVPMNRGILSTIYVRGTQGKSAEDLHALLLKYYAKEPFVHVLPFGQTPQTRHVRGSNMTFIGVAKDRVPGRAIVISALDNLVKGASGQAVQNMNLMLGYPETTGLEQVALFP